MRFLSSCTVAIKCRAFTSNVSQPQKMFWSGIFQFLLFFWCWSYFTNPSLSLLLNIHFITKFSASLHVTYFFSIFMLLLGYTSLVREALGFILLFSVLWVIQIDCYWIFFQGFKYILFAWHICFSRTFVFVCKSVVLHVVYPVSYWIARYSCLALQSDTKMTPLCWIKAFHYITYGNTNIYR